MPKFYTKIVGVSFENPNGPSRQELIAALPAPPCLLHLQRQLDNPYDSNAIAVLDDKGRQLGFLSKDISSRLANELDKGIQIQAKAIQVTGGWPFHYGVNLQIEY